MIGRRERGRTELQAVERSKKRAATEKALRDDDARLALIEAQKVSDMTCFVAMDTLLGCAAAKQSYTVSK